MTTSPRLYPALLLLACLGAMGTALTTQYGFGLKPCILCLYQRVPYIVSGVLMAISLAPRLPPRVRWALVAIAGLAFAIDSGIAVFHVGVEQHLWTSACMGGIDPQAGSVEDLKTLLAGPPPVPCDEAPWRIFGISMAGYNAMFAASLAVFAIWSLGRLKEYR